MRRGRCQNGQSVRVAKTGVQRDGPDDAALLALFRAIASGDDLEVARRLDSSRDLASLSDSDRGEPPRSETYFLTAIRHYVYAGDTALHVAAAAHQRELAESLVTRGAAFALVTEGEPNRSTTPPTGVPARSTGIRWHSVT